MHPKADLNECTYFNQAKVNLLLVILSDRTSQHLGCAANCILIYGAEDLLLNIGSQSKEHLANKRIQFQAQVQQHELL